jgi:hypothetical protein
LIKASNILESISSVFRIDERNLANVDDVDHYIDSFIDMFTDPGTKKWLESKNTLRKYLINDFPGVTELPSIPKHGEQFYQSWMDRLPEDEKVYVLDDRAPGMRDLTTQIRHIMDYFDYAMKHEQEVPTPLKVRDPSRISFEDALKKSQEFTRWYNTRKKDDEEADYGEGESIVKILPGGMKWVEVYSQEALDREGKLMDHCVGTFGDRVRRKDCDIISLRTADNQPVATLDIRDGEVNQIKGYRDGEIDNKYRSFVVDFVQDKGVTDEGASDLINIGCVWDSGEDKIVSLERVSLADYYNHYMGNLPYYEDETEFIKNMSPALISKPDKDGKSGIFYLIDDDKNDLIETVLRADRTCVNDVDPENGETALMYALRFEDFEHGQPAFHRCAYIMLEKGSPKYYLTNKHGTILLHYAIDTEDEWIINEVLYGSRNAINHEFDGQSILEYAVERGVTDEALKSIIDCGVDMEKYGMKALKIAEDNDNEWLIEVLREKMGLNDYADEDDED